MQDASKPILDFPDQEEWFGQRLKLEVEIACSDDAHKRFVCGLDEDVVVRSDFGDCVKKRGYECDAEEWENRVAIDPGTTYR